MIKKQIMSHTFVTQTHNKISYGHSELVCPVLAAQMVSLFRIYKGKLEYAGLAVPGYSGPFCYPVFITVVPDSTPTFAIPRSG